MRQLAADFVGSRGAVDPDTIPVAWDDEGPPTRDPERVWRTAKRAWQLHNPEADWHLLLQDDAILTPGLMDTLVGALEHVPPRCIISLYAGTGRPIPWVWQKLSEQADVAGASWIVGPRSMWGVALLLPVPVIGEMIAYCDTQHGIPDDMRVGRWARRQRYEAWFPWPCLVDHPDDESLVGHGAGRHALRFVGDASSWDPTGPIIRWSRYPGR